MVAWTLVFHVVGMVFWLGSLLVVTQILAIHTEANSAEAHRTLGLLESRLLRGLAHPGAAIMVITGVILIVHDPSLLLQHWLQAKLVLVVILIALDLRLTFRARAFQAGSIELSRRDCMVLHGAISLLFLVILILAMVQPFGPSGVRPRLRGSNGAAELIPQQEVRLGKNNDQQPRFDPHRGRIHDM